MNKLILSLLTLSIGFITYEVKYPVERFEKVATKSLPTVVSIKVTYSILDALTGEVKNSVRSGSGVFVTSDGHILTCAHLFNLPYKRSSNCLIEMYTGEKVKGKVLVVGKDVDLAIVKVSRTYNNKFVQIANPNSLRVGQEVIAIGSPLGLDFTVTHGIISALYRTFEKSYNVTQHDVFMNPGNSGGPVINLKGELVGINSFIISQGIPVFTGLGFSVQSGQCLEFLVKYGTTISPHRRYQWLKVINDAKRRYFIQV
jgi:putative serine protease PepD